MQSTVRTRRYRIEHWHFDEVSILGVSEEPGAAEYVALLRAARSSGVVVVIVDDSGEIVGRWPVWSEPLLDSLSTDRSAPSV